MMLLSSILLPGWIFWQAELPRAPVLFRVLIGRADNAPGANTRINSLCESLVLHESHGFAGKIRKAPPPSRQLNPTLFHPKDHPVTALLDYALLVDPCVQTMSQTFNQGLDSTASFHSQSLHYPLCFHHGKATPGFRIRPYGILHPLLRLHRLKPKPIMRQPILSVIQQNLQQLLAAHIFQSADPIYVHYVTHPHPPRTASSSGRRDGAQDWPPPNHFLPHDFIQTPDRGQATIHASQFILYVRQLSGCEIARNGIVGGITC